MILKKPVKKKAKLPAKKKAVKVPAKKKAAVKAKTKIKAVKRAPVKKATPKKAVKKVAKKAAVKKSAVKKTAVKKSPAKKAVAKKAVAKKVVAKKVAPKKKVAAKKVATKKTPAKKIVAKKVVAKKVVAKKPAARKVVVAPKILRGTYPAAIEQIITQLDDSKAEEIIAINLENKSTMADWMIVASGRSDRHVNAIATHVVDQMHKQGLKNIRVEGMPQCDWVLVDSGDVIVHVFRPEVRSFYNLEKLWSASIPTDSVSGKS